MKIETIGIFKEYGNHPNVLPPAHAKRIVDIEARISPGICHEQNWRRIQLIQRIIAKFSTCGKARNTTQNLSCVATTKMNEGSCFKRETCLSI